VNLISLASAPAVHDSVPFWPSLWPALTATVAGVAFGVPVGLWLNRLALRQARIKQEADRQQTLSRAAHTLRESITWNGEKATSLAESIERGDVPFETPLETQRWEAVRDEFVRSAHDPELQGRVAFFFDQVRRAAQMADRRFDFMIGPASATTFASEVDVALRGQLLQDLPGIAHEAGALDQLLKDLGRQSVRSARQQ
jgi:hypothetical protein